MLKDDIDSLLNEGVKNNDFPGANYKVIYHDGRSIKGSVGYIQTHPVKMRNSINTIYDCASLTKVCSTTPMILHLIEEGKFKLDTKLCDLLYNFKHDHITIKHLLTHSSGLPADIPNAYTLKDKTQVKKYVYNVDLINPVGEKVVYSDIGFILLGFLIETITNKTLDEYAKEVVFGPLKMHDTTYHPVEVLCAPTELREDDIYNGYLQGNVHDEKAFALQNEAGHAGMFSTVDDIGKYLLSLLRNDETILSKETVESLYPIQMEDVSKLGNKLIRSLGFNKPTKNGTTGQYSSLENTILHTGFTGCNIWIEKSKGVAFVMLSNAVHPKRSNNNIFKYRRMISDLILSSGEAE